MAKLTIQIIEQLYSAGRSVYQGEKTLDAATSEIIQSFPNEIAETSAKFYIGLYSEYMSGIGSTWNQNSELVLYYVENIYKELGKESGDKAFRAAMRFAKAKSKNKLIKDLNELRDKLGYEELPPTIVQEDEEYSPGFTCEEWLLLLNDPDIIGPVCGGLLAAFYDAGGEASCKQLGEKYHRSATSISGNCTQLAKAIQKKTGCPVFIKNGTEKYWYILFDIPAAEQKEDGSTVWKLRQELYDALTQFDIMRYQWVIEEEQSVSVKEALPQVKAYITSRGFSYPEGLIENFYLSLKSKPFVILAGTSGTGKTRLVKLFAEAIGADYKQVSVRPDWSDGSDLFGHYDLNGKFIEGPVCDCFEMAEANPQKPVFLCLDEMNLARVEYYLSDFLSVIESREKQEDGSILTTGIAQYETGIPDNLYIVGTVNMDETTFPFSRKVLDRANTIEFNYVDLMPVFDDAFAPQESLKVSNKFLRSEYLILARDCANESVYVNEICGELQAINEILRKANAHVGYRVRDEIVFYMLENLRDGGILKREEAFDNEIMQKILPRLQGSSASVRDMLCELFRHCAADHTQKTGDSDSEKMRKVLEDDSIVCRYRKSAEKLQMMVRRFEDDGFTSYWL